MTEEATAESRSPLDRLGAWKWPTLVVGVLVVLLLGGFVGLKLLFPPEKLRAMVVPRIEAAVGRDVRLSSVSLKVFPQIAVRLEDFAVANAPGFGPEPALELSALDLRPRLFPLLRGELELRELRLLRPVVRFQVGPEGDHNFEGLGAEGGEAAATDGARSAGLLVIADLSVRDGVIHYRDARSGRAARIPEVRADLSSERAADDGEALRSRGSIELRSAELVLPDLSADSIVLPDLGLDYDLFIDLVGDSAAFREIGIALGEVELQGTGRASGLATDLEYSLSLESGAIAIERVLALLPADARPRKLQPEGRARVTAELEKSGGTAGKRRFRGSLALEEVSARYEGEQLVSGGSGSLVFSLDTLRVESFRSQLLGRPFELQATVTDLEDPRVSARVTGGLELADLVRLSGAEANVKGVVSLDLQISGPAAEPASLRITGPVRLSNIEYRTENLAVPVRIGAATLHFATPTVSVEEMPIELGSSDLTLAFTARHLIPLAFGAVPEGGTPSLEFTATSDRFDWGEIGGADTTAGYADLLAARLSGRKVGGRDPAEIARERYRPPPIPPMEATGQVRIREFRNPPTVARDVTFRIRLRGGELELRDLSGKIYGGDLTGSLSLDFSRGRPPFPLRYDLGLSGGQAAAFVSRWTRLGSAVEGTADFSMQGTTALDESLLPLADATDASGQLVLTDGRFTDRFGLTRKLAEQLRLDPGFGSSFQRLGGPFRIEGGAFVLERWRLTASDLSGQISGSAGLGGTLDLSLTLDVPASTLRESGLLQGTGLGDIAGALLGGRENLELGVGVGGTVAEPTFRIDTDALQKQLQGTGEDLLKRLFRPPR